MTSRPSFFVTVTVRHPRLPFGLLWVPFLSIGLYLLAWLVRAALWVVPAKKLRERSGQNVPVDVRRLGPLLTRLAWVVLWSGSYTLADLHVQERRERVAVRVSVW